jgi:hypothetical protein
MIGSKLTASDSENRRGDMADFDPKVMDDAANDASLEIEAIREQHPDGLTAVEDWMKKWVPSAGYKRLGKILADRWG